ncbi:MAG: hypothetical protein HQ523_06960 [Lentisphaerae bacterium]|nr:hypothetical protein [Lentisphaerota bacterium]
MQRSAVTLTLVISLASVLVAGHGLGQQRPAAGAVEAEDARDVLRLRKLVWQGAQAKVKTPEYRTTASKGVTVPGEWWQFTVEYDTKPEWIDDLTFQFYVLGVGVVEGKKAYSFYSARVSYIDIKEGRGHKATVFLRPNTVERYGEPAAFAVEIYHNGQMVLQETEAATKVSKLWWKDPQVIDSPLVSKRDGVLLNRARSPFAYVDVDAYETIKQ